MESWTGGAMGRVCPALLAGTQSAGTEGGHHCGDLLSGAGRGVGIA